MIKHIVMWRLHDFADNKTKSENAKLLKNMFSDLPSRIERIRFMEVGINLYQTGSASDVVLYSGFDSIEHLRSYQNHPANQKMARFLNLVRSEKRVVDYEV